jgi:hypothetical protein
VGCSLLRCCVINVGLGHSACSAKGGCRGSFDLVLLVIHLREEQCVCTNGET